MNPGGDEEEEEVVESVIDMEGGSSIAVQDEEPDGDEED